MWPENNATNSDNMKTACMIYFISMVGFLGVPAPVTHHPEISSYLSNGTYVYINEPVTVTCQTRDSQAHAWQSTELFGKGSNIAFTSDQTAGSVHHIGRDIEVILVSVDTISGELIIRSQIQFTVNSSYNDLITITCLNIDFGTSSSITFHITGKHDYCYKNHSNCPQLATSNSVCRYDGHRN